MRPWRTLGWDVRRESLAEGRTRRIAPSRGGRPIPQREAVEAWHSDESFRTFFVTLLREAPFEAFFWETPVWDPERPERTFEFVLVDAPSLVRIAPDPRAFDEHFARASGVVVFENLGGDAELVVPTPGPNPDAYAHLAAFARRARAEQQDLLWRTVGERMHAARERSVFLSTSGLGVPWVHVRIDERPKYYVHGPYRAGGRPRILGTGARREPLRRVRSWPARGTRMLMDAIATLWMAWGLGLLGQEQGGARIGGVAFEARTIAVEGTTVAVADVDGDGRLDVVSAGARLAVQLGDGAGGLRPGARVEAGENPSDIALVDVSGDGAIDAVIANHDVHYVTILLADGNGGFRPAEQSPLAIDVDPHPHAVAAADLDGDGRADLMVDHSPRGRPTLGTRRDAGGVLVLPGAGDGRFASPGEVFASGGVPYRGFAVGDVDSDGRPDLVTPLDREVGVLLNTSEPGRASFERGRPIEATAPFAVRLGDLNGDGNLDVVVAAGEESDRVEVLLGDGRGGFEAAEESPMRLANGGKSIVLGDFDGDGTMDAAVSAYRSAEILVVRGGAESLEATRLATGHEHPWGLAAGDLNADGADDLLVAGDGERRGTLYLSLER